MGNLWIKRIVKIRIDEWDSMRVNENQWILIQGNCKKHVIIRKMDTEWIFDNIKELLLIL